MESLVCNSDKNKLISSVNSVPEMFGIFSFSIIGIFDSAILVLIKFCISFNDLPLMVSDIENCLTPKESTGKDDTKNRTSL
ncbi:hypothetical protein CNEONATNEC26_03462 [Clostridium neonatale]|nr:hypothetical protein CNEONATNEC26_03462 [Clostridium neonatale]